MQKDEKNLIYAPTLQNTSPNQTYLSLKMKFPTCPLPSLILCAAHLMNYNSELISTALFPQ